MSLGGRHKPPFDRMSLVGRLMKAIVYHTYGSPDVLKLEDVKKPTPRDDEVLIKIHAVSVNRSDWEMLRGTPLMPASEGF